MDQILESISIIVEKGQVLQFIFFMVTTVLIEMIVAYTLGFKSKYQLLSIFAVNAITNPTLNFILYVLYMIHAARGLYQNFLLSLVVLLEIFVIYIEYRLIIFAFPNMNRRKIIKVVLFANIVSALFSLIISKQF